MNRVDVLKRKLVNDIVFYLFLIVLTIPLWMYLNVSASVLKNADFTAKYVSMRVLNKSNAFATSITDAIALRTVETSDIIVYNNFEEVDDYSLLLKIKKNTADLEKVKVNINYNVKYLTDFYFISDSDYYYFILDENVIGENPVKYIISLWTGENLSYLNYDFVLSQETYL